MRVTDHRTRVITLGSPGSPGFLDQFDCLKRETVTRHGPKATVHLEIRTTTKSHI